jgi:hypothetical protein
MMVSNEPPRERLLAVLRGQKIDRIPWAPFLTYWWDINLTVNYEDYEKEIRKNPDTLYLPLISPFGKTAFQSMIEFWVGTEELSYLVTDYAETVESYPIRASAVTLKLPENNRN